MRQPAVALELRRQREHARLNHEELLKKLEQHGYKFSKSLPSQVECGRSSPSFEYLRGCELVFGLNFGDLTMYWVLNIAETRSEAKHITAHQFAELLRRGLQRLQNNAPTPPLENRQTSTSEDAVEEQAQLGKL